ncbi:MAG: hypothetical protein AAFY88_29680, partial [Acidobacteriota bacterium]
MQAPSPHRPAPSTARRVLQNLAVAAVATLVGLLVIEGAARLLYERPWYEHLAETQAAAETMNYQMNSFGLRGPEFVQPKP